jgi:hypothetical protein
MKHLTRWLHSSKPRRTILQAVVWLIASISSRLMPPLFLMPFKKTYWRFESRVVGNP